MNLKINLLMTEEITMCSKDIVTITCYNKTSQMERKQAIEFYTSCVLCSEGSERERYAKILAELIDNYKVCSDE